MHELVTYLNNRRLFMMRVVIFLALLAIAASYYLQIQPAKYFNGKYNVYFVYALIIYKLIELSTLYYILFHRHLSHIRKNIINEERYEKIKKHSKLLLFLIPQGNFVFGVIAYKLTGSILYFLLFSFVAFITLFLVKPTKLKH